MKLSKPVLLLTALLLSQPSSAREISGIKIPDSTKLAGQELVLNGGGIRTKFVFDIYIGALYLGTKTNDAKTAIGMPGPKRVLMHFLYDEVEKEKLTAGWTKGFENNLTEKEFIALKPRLMEFNALFSDAKEGDEVMLDYLPDKGTMVSINKQQKGAVAGEDFNHALLKVWLGDDPADGILKEGMLGNYDG